MVALIQPRARASAAGKSRFAFTRSPVPAAVSPAPSVSLSAGSPTLARPFYAASGAGGQYVRSQSGGSPWTVTRTIPMTSTAGGIAFLSEPTITGGTGSVPTSRGQQQFSFMLDDSAFEVMTQSSGNRYYVRVDGEYVADTIATPATMYQTATAASQWRKFDFGVRRLRRIDIIGGSGSDALSFMGIAISGTGAIYPAPVRGPRVICVGDSFTGNSIHSWTHWFADAMGWDDVWPSGVGGTGLLNTNGGTAKTFRQRLATDVLPFNPDIVLMHGGVNDGGANAALAGAEAAAFAQDIRAALPGCIVIGGCNATKGVETLAAGALDLRDAVRAGFRSGGGVWLDITEQPLAGTPARTALYAARSAGTAGNAGTVTAASASVGIPCLGIADVGTGEPLGLRVGSTVDIGTGATRERKVITGTMMNGGRPVYAFDGPFLYSHAAGEPVVEVGPSYITGRGQAGAGGTGGTNGVNGPSGWGTADLWCSSDAIHPTTADLLSAPFTNGQYAIGRAVAGLVQGYLNAQG